MPPSNKNANKNTNFKAKTTVWDYSTILFGGEIEFTTSYGTINETKVHVFRDAFNIALSPERLQRAKEKTGYMPLTRQLLESDRLRHEVLEGDESKDTKTILANMLQKVNDEAVKFLIDYGMDDCYKLARTIKRVSKEQQAVRIDITLPHTFDRRQRIMKASKPGDYYRIGHGGIAYNCDDCIIAIEMKRIEKKKNALAKRKTSKTKRETQINNAKDVMEKGNKRWTIPDFIKMIRYKTPKAVLSSKNRKQLKVIWNTVKALPVPDIDDIPKWSEKDESNLIEFQKDG